MRALAVARKEHPRAARRLLVLDRDSMPRVVAPDITVQTAYEWLLAETVGR